MKTKLKHSEWKVFFLLEILKFETQTEKNSDNERQKKKEREKKGSGKQIEY